MIQQKSRRIIQINRTCLLTVLGVVITIFGFVPSTYAATVAKPGAKCLKIGQIQIVGGKKLTCIKSGSKLIWNKGVVILVTPPASNAQLATPTPIPSPSVSRNEFDCTNKSLLLPVSNLTLQWQQNSLVFNFDWDRLAKDNWCGREFVINYTIDGVVIESMVDQFPISGEEIKRRIELTENMNVRTFNVFSTNFTSVCVSIRTRFWVESPATCISGPTYRK